MTLPAARRVEFALGLIGIGKPWGFANPEVPDERQALTVLERAFTLGVRYFDTAPSYGVSEERLGRFLAALTPGKRSAVRIATKFGKHWEAAIAEPFVDHSLDALKRSLDGSFARLGRIDFLQLHKTTGEVLGSINLAGAWEYAAALGITAIGASVSDLESAGLAIADPAYRILQFPYNTAQQTFAGVLDRAAARGMTPSASSWKSASKALSSAAPSRRSTWKRIGAPSVRHRPGGKPTSPQNAEISAELMPRRRRGGMGWETWLARARAGSESDFDAEARRRGGRRGEFEKSKA